VVPAHSVQRLTRHKSACFRSRAPGPVSGQLYETRRLEGPAIDGSAFLVPFGYRHSLLGRPVPATGFRFPYGRPTTTTRCDGPDGVTTFHTHEKRPGRVPAIPGSSGVHATIGQCSVAACRFSTARSLSSPPARPDSGSCRNEASPLVHSGSPFRSSPHLWHPVGAGTLGLPPGLRTRPLPATHARGGDRSRTLTEVTSSTSSRTSNRRTTQGVRPRVALVCGRRACCQCSCSRGKVRP
jgi:hypothetical protein